MIFAFKTLLIFSKPKNVSFCVKTTVALRSSSLPLEILIYGLVYRYLILFDINLKVFWNFIFYDILINSQSYKEPQKTSVFVIL